MIRPDRNSQAHDWGFGPVMYRPLDLVVALGSALAVITARKVIRNARRVPALPAHPPDATEVVSVLMPARDEAARIGPSITSLLAQRGVPNLEILVLDDGSSDGTAEVVRSLAAGDFRVRVLAGRPLAAGWKGKPHACMQLAEVARGSVLVFVDADVAFAPQAIAGAVALLRSTGRDLLCPFPRQVMGSAAERMYQPLVQWAWMSNMPPTGSSADPPPTFVANGQFMVFDAAAYRRAGGHGAVRDATAEDHAILYALLGSGGSAAAVDGSRAASCRMYSGPGELVDGYTKWMCDWHRTPRQLSAALGTLAVIFVLPAAAALRGSKVGLVGYLAIVASRVVVARRFGEPALPHAFTHPIACVATGAILVEARRRRGRDQILWKGRAV